MDKSKLRHIFKAFSWRFFGSLDTLLLSYILTAEISFGLKITLFELLSKTVLYYFHERFWFNLRLFKSKSSTSKMRHFLKMITWRFVATIDTIIIGFYITGRFELGVLLGGLELFTKMGLYYLHERLWYKSKFGIR